MATPFVQGHLLDRTLEVEIATACAHCGEPITITVGSDLGYRVHQDGASPLVFEPQVDWTTFPDPTIIDGY